MRWCSIDTRLPSSVTFPSVIETVGRTNVRTSDIYNSAKQVCMRACKFFIHTLSLFLSLSLSLSHVCVCVCVCVCARARALRGRARALCVQDDAQVRACRASRSLTSSSPTSPALLCRTVFFKQIFSKFFNRIFVNTRRHQHTRHGHKGTDIATPRDSR